MIVYPQPAAVPPALSGFAAFRVRLDAELSPPKRDGRWLSVVLFALPVVASNVRKIHRDLIVECAAWSRFAVPAGIATAFGNPSNSCPEPSYKVSAVRASRPAAAALALCLTCSGKLI